MKLTHERANGIKTGYWSSAKKDDLVQKLGPIEKEAGKLALKSCHKLCPHNGPFHREDAYCKGCPLWELLTMFD